VRGATEGLDVRVAILRMLIRIRLKESLFNEDLSPHEAGVAEGVHKVAGMCVLGVAKGVRLAT
jgi:hypothetical protein